MKLAISLMLLSIVCHASVVTNVLLDFDSGIDGAAVDLTTITNSTHGTNGAFSYSAVNLPAFTFSTDGQKNLIGRENIAGIGTFYGNGLVGLRTETTNNSQIKFLSSFKTNKASVGWWIKSTIPPASIATFDAVIIWDASPSAYANCSLNSGPAGGYRFGLETGGENHPLTTNYYATNVWWWLTMIYDANANNQLKIYDQNLALQETLTSTGNRSGATNASYVLMGPVFDSAPTPGYYVYFDNVIFDFYNAVFPLMPGQPPDATATTMRVGSLVGK